MQTIILNCVCGNNGFLTRQIDDGKEENKVSTALAICSICIANGCRFDLSPYWREPKRGDDRPVSRMKAPNGKVRKL
jgi:hypothetical protein